MALDQDTRAQLGQYLALMENPITITLSAGDDEVSKQTTELVEELKQISPKIEVVKAQLPRTPSFALAPKGQDARVTFAGVPLGHEFTSLVLALLQVSGRAPKLDANVIETIKGIKGEFHFETYVSLTCHNCPDVVQALNTMSVLNPNITHTMIEGGAFKDEIEAKQIMAVPTIFLNGEEFGSGRMGVEDFIAKIDTGAAKRDAEIINKKDTYDVLVLGGGPAGAAAAIYAARKGIRTGLVAERFGGQVMDTLAIENFISVPKTEGPKLVAGLEEHVKDYAVDLMTPQRAVKVSKGDLVEVELENGGKLKTKSLIISTGARWRNINVPGEDKFKTKGVAYCPHCDGPLFKGKHVAVIGGGNSGVEAAIDLAGIVDKVTLIEFGEQLRADAVLQKRLYSLPNVAVLTNAATKEITGTDVVNGLTYADRATNEEYHIELQGVFIQIGLVPNTEFLGDVVEKTKFGEIVVDSHGATNVEGIFAAGDCTNSAYKQIIIAMGSGATASLGAFDYLIRN